jgi:WD40 repeat protein
MGEVRVVHDSVLGRDVAMKTPRSTSPTLQRRLVAEARLAATLEHPGIVPVHDAGRLPDGTPFYTMRLARGRSLAAALADRADIGLRLVRHVLDAARAVAWAHAHGVLHRDLKPANIIVGPAGETQVIDWGLGGTDKSHSNDGRLGTPGFMSPEAERGDTLDARSDVYGLGACLAAVLDALPRPFPEAFAIAARARTPNPADRYATAGAFADELERFLDGRPVAAHAYRMRDHFGRWWRGERAALMTATAATAIVTGLLIAGIVSIGAERDAALKAHDDAREALARALVFESETLDEAGARPEAEHAAAQALVLDPEDTIRARALGIIARHHDHPFVSLRASFPTRACTLARLSPSGNRHLCVDPDELQLQSLDGAAHRWRTVWRVPARVNGAAMLDAVDLALTTGHDDRVSWWRLADGTSTTPSMKFEYSRNLVAAGAGHRALGYHDNFVHLFDGRSLRDWRFDACTPSRDTLVAAAISHDGTHVAWGCASGLLVVADADTGAVTTRIDPDPTRRHPAAMAFTPDGRHLLVAPRDGTLTRVDLGPNPQVVTLPVNHRGTRQVHALYSSDRAALIDERGTPRIVSFDDGGHIFDLPRGAASLAFAVAQDDTLWSHGTAIAHWTIGPHAAMPTSRSGFLSIAFAPDGARVAFAENARVGIITLGGASPTRDWEEPPGRKVKGLAFTRDGRFLVSVHAGAPHGTLFDLVSDGARSLIGATEALHIILPFRDGSIVAVPHRERVHLMRLDTTEALLTPVASEPLPHPIRDASLDPSATWAVWLDTAGRFGVLRPDGDEVHISTAATIIEGVGCVAASPSSQGLFVGSAVPPAIFSCDLTQCRTLVQLSERPTDLAISPDGRLVAVGLVGGEVLVYDVTDIHTPFLRMRDHAHTDHVAALAFAPDGRLLISASWDGRIARWDLTTLATAPDILLQMIARRWGWPKTAPDGAQPAALDR